MAGKLKTESELRERRHNRLRKKVRGTPERPRLSVFRSAKHIHAQLVDDVNSVSLLSASTLEPSIKADSAGQRRQEAAARVGKLIAEKALGRGITRVAFDRGGYQYHGRVQRLAEAAREGGLEF